MGSDGLPRVTADISEIGCGESFFILNIFFYLQGKDRDPKVSAPLTTPVHSVVYAHTLFCPFLFTSVFTLEVISNSTMGGLFSGGSLKEEQLENLKLYKYSAVDKSFTTKFFLKHYWNWTIELFPLWMAYVLFVLSLAPVLPQSDADPT